MGSRDMEPMLLADGDDDDDDEEEGRTRGIAAPKKKSCGDVVKQYLIVLVVLLWMVVGLVVLTAGTGHADDMSVLTAMYVIVQIITTVGYGDICPKTEGMKLFMAFYVLIGIVVIAGVITKVSEALVERAEEMFRDKLRSTEAALSGDIDSKEAAKKQMGPFNELLAAGAIFLVFIGIGTLYYGVFQKCTCSYGRTQEDNYKAGCNALADELTCISTGGYKRTVLDGFYMSCITLTTVGFGDESPQSWEGRLFGIFWMLIGVVAMANFVTAFTSYALESGAEQKKFGAKELTRELFNEIDVDGSGYLSKYEYVSYVLVQHGKLTKEDLETIAHNYDLMDTAGDNQVTYEDVMASSF